MANITEEQKQKITAWIEDYATLGEIQKRLKEELEINVTYMEMRFLLEDLGLEIRERPEPPKPEPAQAETGASPPPPTPTGTRIPEPDGPAPGDVGGAAGAGKTSVTVDQIIRPSMMMSGKVVFADGQKASWYVDQTGQLGLDVATPGYRPSPENIAAFQKELRVAIGRG